MEDAHVRVTLSKASPNTNLLFYDKLRESHLSWLGHVQTHGNNGATKKKKTNLYVVDGH